MPTAIPQLKAVVRPHVLYRHEQLLQWAGWAVVIWIIFFWRLGYPSFWDPDEAHYAETSREMLAAHNWLVPIYDGQPFFDKPVLFHWLQMAAFSFLGVSEFAARLVPALAGTALVGCTAWLGVDDRATVQHQSPATRKISRF
jgi:4-amino-4-deoxy-L-arabinose transferase-like glycosyltransferase